MTVFEILCIGIALSMDAFSVSLSSGMVYPDMTKSQKLSMPIAFGIFQGIMPVLGYFLCSVFADFINKWQGPISLVILCAIGINMIKEGLEKDKETENKSLTIYSLIILAVATSIDAFAVGVSFAASGLTVGFSDISNNIFTASGIIAVSTFVLCILALILGKKVGEKLGDRAEIVGGIILIIIGIKNMFF